MFLMLAASVALSLFGPPAVSLQPVGVDPLTTPGTLHQTAVGPVIATNGGTSVTVFQVGRYTGDASAAMGFSTTFDGTHWNAGLLPGLTKAQNSVNPYDRITFPTIVWNARYNVFIVSMLPISNVPSNGDSDTTLAPIVMRSQNGLNWTAPAPVSTTAGIRPEKNWIVCDNFVRSPHFGNCYVVWDDNDNGDQFHAAVSTDGGQTWGPTLTSPDGHSAYGLVPVVTPNGNVVVTSEDSSGYDLSARNIISFVSTTGGKSWSPAYEIASFNAHTVAGNMRTQSLPTTTVDDFGVIYTVWQDCRFRSGCSANDLVLSTSRDGVAWSSPSRIVLDSASGSVDHFLPSLAVRNSFFGTTLGLSYYSFPQANCTVATCALYADFAQSYNDGVTWATPTQLAGPLSLSRLPLTGAGYMVGDYFTSVYAGNYLAPLALGYVPSTAVFNEAIYMPTMAYNGFGVLLGSSRDGRSAGGAEARGSGLGAADSAALHAGSLVPASNAVRRAPATQFVRKHHPM